MTTIPLAHKAQAQHGKDSSICEEVKELLIIV
jgi:hypothetical protein